jgi:colanic acid/amylovoran biosynthesis glycosyltransferase
MNNRILIFTDNYPFGKSEPFLDTELSYIVNSFEKVSIMPLEKGRDKKVREVYEKMDIQSPVFNEIKNKKELLIKGLFNISLLFSLLKEGLSSGVWKSRTNFRIWFTHLLMIRSLMADIRNRDLIRFFNEFDILYFYWGLRWSQVIPFLPEYLKPKIIVRFHGSDLYEHTNNGYIPWRYHQLKRINKAIVISETGKKYIEDHYPFLNGRIVISRIGTKDYGLNPYTNSDIIRIVSCSNLVAVKRVGLIAETLESIKRRVEWIHFGDGPLRNQIEKLLIKLPENITIMFKGAVKHSELMNYYCTTSVDLFINVSSSEGVPVSVMEALSFGIPVIATNVGGTKEIVSEKTGLLIEKDFSTSDLATKIEELANRSDFIELRRTARKEWENKSMADKVFPEFISQILSV